MFKNIIHIIFLTAFITISSVGRAKPPIDKISSLGKYHGYNTKDYKGYSYQSQYAEMPDGIKLATDVFLPKAGKEGEKFPTIIYFVRYGRSLELKGIMKNRKKPLKNAHVPHEEVNFFASHGYACVLVDLRGSGASFGYRKMEFSDEEIQDMDNIMDWVSEQSWCNQKLATTGISYTGTTAELALISNHPNLKASIVRSGTFDLYDDLVAPGGIRQSPFIQSWKETTVALDNNDFKIFGTLARLFVKGINPVQGDQKRAQLKAAVNGHEKNFDIFTGIMTIESRDDKEPINQTSVDDYSIHNRVNQIVKSGVPIYRISGWYDGGNVQSAVKATLNIKNTEKLLIGPWDHGPHNQTSPFNTTHKVKFDVYSEMLRFFDYHMQGIENGINNEPKVHYYHMGEEKFKGSDEWPLKSQSATSFLLSDNNRLIPKGGRITAGKAEYVCDYTVSTTIQSRWNSLTPLYKNGNTQYPDRQKVNEKMLCFQTEPMDQKLDISGFPEVDLYVSVDAKDAYFFVYLEDVAPNGTSTYITEGQLRGAFRKVTNQEQAPYETIGTYHSFLDQDKQVMVPEEITRIQVVFKPISYRLPKGHRLQLSIAAADAKHFDVLPKGERPEKIKVYYSTEHNSKITIPEVD